LSKTLLKYIPNSALPLISSWFKEYNFHLRISKRRNSKFGDFRPAFKNQPNRISVNGDLNQYHFLITLTHEVAHAAIWQQYKNKVLPHGKEWKSKYSELLRILLSQVHIPADLESVISTHLQKPSASSCNDPELFKALKEYDPSNDHLYLSDIDLGTLFIIHGKRTFKKGKKRRTRYECFEISSKKIYLISGHAEVKLTN